MPPSEPINYRKFYQLLFLVAGIYNVLWGLISLTFPQWFFVMTEMPLINYPQIFMCLGMVVGLYGLIYLEIARKPEEGWLLAAVGLLGKVLGPLGMLNLVLFENWPPSAFYYMCLSNDLIWWLPFSLYLYHAWPFYRKQLQ